MPKKPISQKPEILPSEPEIAVKSMVYKKIATAVVILFLIFAAALLILNRQYKGANKEADQKLNDLNANRVDPVQLEKDYRQNFTQTMNGYLVNFDAGASLTKSDLLDKTKGAEEKIISLTVPAKFKDVHLAAVLLLSGLENGLNANDNQIIESKLKNLRDLVAKF